MHAIIDKQPTKYIDIREKIQDGDCLIFCGENWISWNSGGPAYHIGMAKWAGCSDDRESDNLMIIQALQWHFPSASLLSNEVIHSPGAIQVARPLCDPKVRTKAAEIALSYTGRNQKYGWMSVVKSSLLHAPLLHFLCKPFYNPDPDETGLSPVNSHKDCSQLFEWSYRKAGFPLVADKYDVFVEPNDLYHSTGKQWLFRNLVP